MAGAFVAVDREGAVIIDRGWVRREDFAKLDDLLNGQAEQSEADHDRSGFDGDNDHDDSDSGPVCDDTERGDDAVGAGLSAALARDLSAYRTAALQLEVARRPQVALALLVDRLVPDGSGHRHHGNDGSVTIRAERVDPLGNQEAAPMVTKAMRELHARADARLSPNRDERLDQLLAMNDADLLELLAVCVGASIDARVSRPTEQTKARGIAEAVALDMSAHWSATAATYFGHVTKKLILEAVGEFAPKQVNRLSALKRKDMAEEAERLAHGTGWLPPALRRPLRKHALQRAKPSSNADEASGGISREYADDADVAVTDDKLDAEHESEREAV